MGCVSSAATPDPFGTTHDEAFLMFCINSLCGKRCAFPDQDSPEALVASGDPSRKGIFCRGDSWGDLLGNGRSIQHHVRYLVEWRRRHRSAAESRREISE